MHSLLSSIYIYIYMLACIHMLGLLLSIQRLSRREGTQDQADVRPTATVKQAQQQSSRGTCYFDFATQTIYSCLHPLLRCRQRSLTLFNIGGVTPLNPRTPVDTAEATDLSTPRRRIPLHVGSIKHPYGRCYRLVQLHRCPALFFHTFSNGPSDDLVSNCRAHGSFRQTRDQFYTEILFRSDLGLRFGYWMGALRQVPRLSGAS